MSPHLQPPSMRKAATRPAGRTASARNAVGSTRRSTRTRARHAGRPFPFTRREVPAFENRRSRRWQRVSHLPEPAWGGARQAKSVGGPVTIFDGQTGDAQVLHLPAQGMRGVSWQRAR